MIRRILHLLAWSIFIVLSGMASADDSFALGEWRDEAARIRQLAENDVPRALAAAQRLQENLPAGATPVDQARALNLLARLENYRGLIEEADQHARRALALARQQGDRVEQAQAYLNLVLSSINQGKLKELETASIAAVEVLDGVNGRPDLLAEAMERMSMMYRRLGKLDESVTMAMQLMEIANRSNSPLALTHAHQCMAISFNLSGRKAEALEHFRHMREQAQAARSGMLEAEALLGLSAQSSDATQAESYLRDAVLRYRQIGAPYALNHALYVQADYLRNQHRDAEALSSIDEVISIYGRFPSKIGLWYALNLRSEIAQAMGRLSAAKIDAEQAYRLSREIDLPGYIGRSARRMGEVAAAAGDHRRAYRFAAEAASMADKAAQEHGYARIVELAQRYQTESKQRKIGELSASLAQHQLRQRWLWTVIGGFAALLGIAFYFMLQLRRSREEIRILNANLEQRIQAGIAELRQQTNYLRTLIDTLPSMVWMKDRSSRYLVVNQAIAQVSGKTVEEMIGKSDLDVWPRELAVAYRADDAEVMASRRLKVIEKAAVNGHGEFWSETYKAPVLDEDGTVLGTVGFALDISKRKAADAAREAALAEAKRLARLRSEFLAQMSHELRTPLNGILGYAQILQRDANLSERQSTGLTVIRQSGDHLLTLINDILDFAKVEAGKQVLDEVDIRLEGFLRNIAGTIAIRAEQKHLGFKLEQGADLPEAIRGDAQRLRQVLFNLLSNAVKFTDRGEVCLRVSAVAGGRLRFEVRDTGIGIPQDRLHRIFQPFEQAGDRQRWIEGTGLGLAISSEFVRLMGSRIAVESRIGEGSRFSFELALPAAESAPDTETPAAEGRISGYQGERRTILVVEDVVDSRRMLLDVLGHLGFGMVEATTGREAIAAAQTRRPDLILMDVAMPDMDGLEAVRRLREVRELMDVPIMAISASASGSDAAACLAAGMDAFLPKPVELNRLLERIGTLLALQWIYGGQENAPPRIIDKFEPVLLPEREQMVVLHRLALQGNISDIVKWADRIVGVDERHRPLAEYLRQLVRNFESQAILEFAENILEGDRTS